MATQILQIRTFSNWTAAYAKKRYLEFCSEGQLMERHSHLLSAITRVDHGGTITSIEEPARLQFEIRLSDIATELSLRGIDSNDWIDKCGHRMVAPVMAIPTSLLLETTSKHKTKIYKYGKQIHLENFLDGRLRFTRASSYTDASLTRGQQDKELEIVFRGRGENLTMEAITGPLRGQKISGIENFDLTEHLARDYFASCFTARLDQRFVSDFDANAILIIDEVSTLRDRLTKAINARFGTRLHAEYGPIEYVDIHFPRNAENDVSFQKHLQYYYQQEYRIALFPLPDDWIRDRYFHLEIGSIRDVARLIPL